MSIKYKDVLDASQPNWKAELKAYLDKGEQIAAINIPADEIRDCIALGQEHDFACLVEDKEVNVENYPGVQPEILGFVPRDRSKRISN